MLKAHCFNAVASTQLGCFADASAAAAKRAEKRGYLNKKHRIGFYYSRPEYNVNIALR
jgi:hypothetical protein